MNKIHLILLLFVFISCRKVTNNDTKHKAVFADSLNKTTTQQITDCSSIDSLAMQTSDYQGIKFYTENTLRGKGVIEIFIKKRLEILNSDKTLFGNISPINDDTNTYEINLPKTVIAREIIPDSEFSVFSFDSELPQTDKDYLIIYINKEKKMIKKSDEKYDFLSWDKYVKSAYIQLNENDNYLYKVLEINKDSLKIKSIPKSDCDYVQHYKDITKWVKWKDNNCKLIKLNFCY